MWQLVCLTYASTQTLHSIITPYSRYSQTHTLCIYYACLQIISTFSTCVMSSPTRPHTQPPTLTVKQTLFMFHSLRSSGAQTINQVHANHVRARSRASTSPARRRRTATADAPGRQPVTSRSDRGSAHGHAAIQLYALAMRAACCRHFRHILDKVTYSSYVRVHFGGERCRFLQ